MSGSLASMHTPTAACVLYYACLFRHPASSKCHACVTCTTAAVVVQGLLVCPPSWKLRACRAGWVPAGNISSLIACKASTPAHSPAPPTASLQTRPQSALVCSPGAAAQSCSRLVKSREQGQCEPNQLHAVLGQCFCGRSMLLEVTRVLLRGDRCNFCP